MKAETESVSYPPEITVHLGAVKTLNSTFHCHHHHYRKGKQMLWCKPYRPLLISVNVLWVAKDTSLPAWKTLMNTSLSGSVSLECRNVVQHIPELFQDQEAFGFPPT